jgi:hypothetical protein
MRSLVSQDSELQNWCDNTKKELCAPVQNKCAIHRDSRRHLPKAMNRMAREMFSPLKSTTEKRRRPLIDDDLL